MLDSLKRIDELLFTQKVTVGNDIEPESGNGVPVDGVKGANDYHAEQNTENASAV